MLRSAATGPGGGEELRGGLELAAPMAMNALQSAITEVDITALLQPRTGYLWKLGGGQETGSKYVAGGPRWPPAAPRPHGVTPLPAIARRWNRRWFVLRDNVLMYFRALATPTMHRARPQCRPAFRPPPPSGRPPAP